MGNGRENSGQIMSIVEQFGTPTIDSASGTNMKLLFWMSSLMKQFWLIWFQLKSLHLSMFLHEVWHCNTELTFTIWSTWSGAELPVFLIPIPNLKHPEEIIKIKQKIDRTVQKSKDKQQ